MTQSLKPFLRDTEQDGKYVWRLAVCGDSFPVYLVYDSDSIPFSYIREFA